RRPQGGTHGTDSAGDHSGRSAAATASPAPTIDEAAGQGVSWGRAGCGAVGRALVVARPVCAMYCSLAYTQPAALWSPVPYVQCIGPCGRPSDVHSPPISLFELYCDKSAPTALNSSL